MRRKRETKERKDVSGIGYSIGKFVCSLLTASTEKVSLSLVFFLCEIIIARAGKRTINTHTQRERERERERGKRKQQNTAFVRL